MYLNITKTKHPILQKINKRKTKIRASYDDDYSVHQEKHSKHSNTYREATTSR